MDTFQIVCDFQNGEGWKDITNIVTGLDFTRTLSILEISTLEITLKGNTNFFQQYISSNKNILVEVKKNGSFFFVGYVRSNGSFTVNEKLGTYPIQVLDNSVLLEKTVQADTVIENCVLCDNSTYENSLIHQILILAGLTNFNISLYNATEFPIFILSKGEMFSDVLETLLTEYGYAYYFDETGTLTIKNLYPESVSPLIHFDNSNMLHGFSITKNDNTNDGVLVKWRELTLHNNLLLYRAITNPDDYETILSRTYYPAGSNVKDIFPKYSLPSLPKDVELFHSFNHQLNYSGPNLQVEETYESKQAKIRFYNPTDGNLQLSKFDIRGSAYVKDAEQESEIAGNNVEEFSTNYIFTTKSAERYSKILFIKQKKQNYNIEIFSKQKYPVGTFATVEDTSTGISLTVLITSKTETQNDPIVKYEAISFTDIGFVIPNPTTKTSVKGIYAGQDGEDAYRVEIVSSAGDVFRMTQEFSTTLEARVIQGGIDISSEFLEEDFRWNRYSGEANQHEDAVWNSSHFSIGGRFLTINQADVIGRSVFNCSLLNKRRI